LFKLVGKERERVERRIEKEDRGGMREMEGENKYENINIKREGVEEKEDRGGTREMEGADKNEEGGKQRVLRSKKRGAREKREREREETERRESRGRQRRGRKDKQQERQEEGEREH
jgi:hypothetical protein